MRYQNSKFLFCLLLPWIEQEYRPSLRGGTDA